GKWLLRASDPNIRLTVELDRAVRRCLNLQDNDTFVEIDAFGNTNGHTRIEPTVKPREQVFISFSLCRIRLECRMDHRPSLVRDPINQESRLSTVQPCPIRQSAEVLADQLWLVVALLELQPLCLGGQSS